MVTGRLAVTLVGTPGPYVPWSKQNSGPFRLVRVSWRIEVDRLFISTNGSTVLELSRKTTTLIGLCWCYVVNHVLDWLMLGHRNHILRDNGSHAIASFDRCVAKMRCQNDVVHRGQTRCDLRFMFVDVECSASNLMLLQRRHKCLLVDNWPPCGVDEERRGLRFAKSSIID